VLGPVEAVDRDGALALGGPKQLTLLGVLLVERGVAVSSDRLIDVLWGERPPASAVKLIQGYVSGLRKALGDGVLLTQGRGYLLQIPPGQLDVDRFDSLAAEGRRALDDGDPCTAAARLGEALALWRGAPLADFAYESFAQPEIARLEESRLATLENRIDAELALGASARLVGELEALVREHPLRERLVGQFMLTLYRSGRQAHALQAYRDARRRLHDELGLEPGRELAQLERAILEHDLALTAPAPVHRPDGRAPAGGAARRGVWLITIGAVVLLAAVIAIAVRLAGSGASAVRVLPNSLAAIDPASDRVVGAVAVGASPGAVAFGSGSLWTANLDDQTISRVDPRTMQVLRTITLRGPPTGIAAADDGLWVVQSNVNLYANTASSISVARVDPEFDTLDSPTKIGNVIPDGPGAVAARGNSVWVAPSAGLLTRLSASTGAVTQRLDPNASRRGSRSPRTERSG
jgi:DNA-binding SARP family transcriptional activator